MMTNEDASDLAVGQLEEEARKRKERLKALRQKLQGKEVEEENTVANPLPRPAFRSYNPKDEQLQEAARPMPLPVNIEEEISDTLEQGQVKTLLEDVELTNLAPRKPDWDLKRDVAPKLQKLERRTQRAIAELILERLGNKEDDLAAAVQLSEMPRGRADSPVNDLD